MKIAILGAGNVGGTLGEAFASSGHNIFFGVFLCFAKEIVLIVVATTRNNNKIDALHKNGVDYVIIDKGQIASQVKQLFPSVNGVNCVLELIGS